MMSLNRFKALSLVVLVAFLFSCNSNPGSSTLEANAVTISVKTTSPTNATLNKQSTTGVANITITSVRVVIDEIELESAIGDTLDFELEQPFVEDLMVGSTLHEIATIQVPSASYKELEIEIDELKPEDGAVYAGNPELQDRSILVKGYLNDDPNATFEFASDLEEEQEQEFNPPIVIEENSPSTNIVLTIDMEMWFVDGNGSFIDPRLPENKSAIEENIKNSIDVFEDKDDDGKKDDDD